MRSSAAAASGSSASSRRRDNPFIVVPVGAASAHLAVGPPADPNGPGPFSLADPNRTRFLLADAGFTDVELESGPAEVVLGTDDDLPGLARRVIEQNPSTSAALAAAAPDVQATALDAVAAALAPHCSNGLVTLGAATWIVTATSARDALIGQDIRRRAGRRRQGPRCGCA